MKTPLFFSLLLLLAACKKSEPKTEEAAPSAEHSDEPGHAPLPKRVHLTTEVIRDARVQSAPVVRESLAQTLILPGEIVADPDKSAQISSPAAGRVTRVDFKEGSVVQKGAVLATLRVTDVARVRSARNAAVAKATAARANADRLHELAQSRMAGAQEAATARAEADALEAEARGLGEELGVLGLGGQGGSDITLRAPLAGVVVSRNAVVGQPVAADQAIAMIADLDEVWFLGRVFEKDLSQIEQNARAEVQLNAYPSQRFHGNVEYVGKRLDPIARTVTARVRLKNHEDLLRIGLFGNAQIEIPSSVKKQPSLVVPRSAVTEIGGKSVVFVQHEDDDFELHEVTLGEGALGKIEILTGLREGERVVVDGVFTLKSVVLKSTLAEDE